MNHPSHYTSDPSGVECIQITRHQNFNRGNAMKYIWRAGLKAKPGQTQLQAEIEDLKKARFYLDDEIKRLEAKPDKVKITFVGDDGQDLEEGQD